MYGKLTASGIAVAALALTTMTAAAQNTMSDNVTYQLDPSWPKMPAGMYFGKQQPFPTPAERAAQQQARQQARARGEQLPPADPRQPGVSGLAIDAQDHVYVFNRGTKPVMEFDRDGNFIRSGADQPINGHQMNPDWIHSGAVDRQGNVYVIERDAHRIVKFNPTLDKVLMQIGVWGEKGFDGTHLNMPSGLAILKNGNLVVTDGYGNERVVLFDKNGKFIKQIGKGAGSPDDKGTGNGEWNLPHKLGVDADENLYVGEETNGRIQELDKNLNFIRILPNEGWVPWDVFIRGAELSGKETYAFVADHKNERVVKLRLSDGHILTAWGKQGWGPSEFDWIHEVVEDSKGAVYAGDTYGQRVQKFLPVMSGSGGKSGSSSVQ